MAQVKMAQVAKQEKMAKTVLWKNRSSYKIGNLEFKYNEL